MSPDTADLPAAFQSAPSSLAGLSGDLTDRTDYPCTDRSPLAAMPYAKQLATLSVFVLFAGYSRYLGFAVPPTPQPLQFHEAGIKPGGFQPGMFQVRCVSGSLRWGY